MPRPEGRPTSADVARASGVSRTTVSYVLNGTPGTTISPATRRRVLDAAERLGYAPSAAARALRRGRSDLVLVVLPDWPLGPVLDELLDRLAGELAARDLQVLVHHGRGRRRLADLWREVAPRTVVGLTAFAADEVRDMRRAGIEVVGARLDEDRHDPTAYAVPQQRIGAMQVEHLVARGRRRVAWAGSTDPRVADFATRRLEGVAAACAAAGLPEPLVAALDLEVASGAAAARAWRAAGVDAVAAYNDEVALAALAGLRAEGLDVPGDVAVVGVDDVPAARLVGPGLTTVHQSVEAQAAHLVAATLHALDGAGLPPAPEEVLHLVVRGTT
ncbi:LacI family DNA-binding transcriptional regulator [Cellulomonas endophytica]|uniref:LacI family DNA-binding transcriptional regulator n=1 Tax=Cellulomonas endophytica TaxID=2494735 RepID=UPI00101378B0|nr:LacI family DNA-binding transcriptional regulator [Cellulomonas endophytica]